MHRRLFVIRNFLSFGITVWLMFVGMMAPASAQNGAAISVNTQSGYKKSNQSKVFYYDSQWWALAYNVTNSKWYIWRYNSGTTWIATKDVQAGSGYNLDATLNPSTGKLYVFSSHPSTPYFRRFSYSAGTWTQDAGYPVTVTGFGHTDVLNPVNLAQAQNGDLWLFRISKKILQAKRSTDGGLTWSDTINVKGNLAVSKGTTDAAAFTQGDVNYIGLAYGLQDSVGSKFGFLIHPDTGSNHAWTDETASLTYFNGERGHNAITLTTDASNNVYLLTRTGNASGSKPSNTLYKRPNTGVWEKYQVNLANVRAWKTPAIAIDATSNLIYAMGVNSTTNWGEYKTCPIGQESSLDTATVATLLSATGKSFDDLSAPLANVNAFSGLMICGDNLTAGDIWFRLFNATTPAGVGTITLSSNQINANAQYTIPLTLSAAGGLAANSGTIHFRFPGNTYVPEAMTASAVLVNGVPCTSVISSNATRQVSLITPVNLSSTLSFTVIFQAAAGLLNSTTISSTNKINAWTSAQPLQANSPNYSLVATTTTVTPAHVVLGTTLPDSCTTYTIGFNLGANGRLIAGLSQITLTFNPATKLTGGTLSGVIVNGAGATATGDTTAKKITITLPSTVSLSNNAAVSLVLPGTAICNPSALGNYTLTVKTTVETSAVTSNVYRITTPMIVGTVAVAPGQVSTPASYTIPLTLSSNGGMTAGIDTIIVRFPAGTILPTTISASQISIAGAPAASASVDTSKREIRVVTPVNLANSATVNVVFNTGAGLRNPAIVGSYTLEAWSTAQSLKGASPAYVIDSSSGSAIAPDTQSGYKKSNQNKVFYYDGQWWALAFYEVTNQWYVWKFDGSAWIRLINLGKSINYNWDAVVNATTNKLYLWGANSIAPEFTRYSYTGGTWTKDAGFPVTLPDFTSFPTDPASLVQAKNGDLWIFRINNNVLQAKHSTSGGATWTSVMTVKSGLTTTNGTTDAVAFTAGGIGYVGVGYAETDSPSPMSKFGFLLHQDTAFDSLWSNESTSLNYFGAERAINNLSMTADASGNVYLFTRNIGAAGADPRNTLYKRDNTGAWQKFKVITANTSRNWKSPALAIEASNNVLYVMGVDITTSKAEYKICLPGNEASLENAAVSNLFSGTGATFDDLSTPAANVGSISGLMTTIDNTATSEIWYRLLPISGASSLVVGNIAVSLNEVNANASYTIPLTLSNNGALAAGAGVINFIFPDNTYVPSNMAPSAVTVAGTPVTSLIANSTTRQVSITTPVNLANGQAFSVVFTTAAGLLNPTTVGSNYQLTGWTSAQPPQVNSPAYGFVQTTTTVTAATVTLYPSDPDSIADYTLAFNLGGRGRLISGASQVTVKFNSATQVTNGALSGVKLNNAGATAAGVSASKQVTITVPSSLSLSNNAAMTLFLPNTVVRNPNITGNYNLTVSTSVETTMVASNPYTIQPYPGIGRAIAGTTKKFDRNNQSKLFYHGGFWWVTAQSKADQKWYLWKFDGATWTQDILVHTTSKNRPDCILDASNNKVYILLPSTSTVYLTRLTYSGSAWSIDAGYPYIITGLTQSSDRGINLVRASNSDLWVFMISDSTLIARRSTNSGQTWTATNIVVKDSLQSIVGLTDAVAFFYSGNNYVGVGYAEDSAPGSVYGFLRHRNSDPDTAWTDETAAIPQFSFTNSDDHMSMAVYNNEVFMIVKTSGGGPAATSTGLLHRKTNAMWSQYPIFLSSGWTRPALAIDQSNNMLYAIGTREGGLKVGETKNVALGSYSSLVSAPIDTIFQYGSDNFVDVSVASHAVTSAMNLLICAGNDTRDETWYNLKTLGVAKVSAEEVADVVVAEEEEIDGVQVYPNPFNPQTSFRFKLKETAPVKLQIFNLNGQLVRTLADAEMKPGVHVKRWNGRAQNGFPAATGLYLYRLQIGDKILQGRIQMIK